MIDVVPGEFIFEIYFITERLLVFKESAKHFQVLEDLH